MWDEEILNTKIECPKDKRKERTNLNRQIKRQEDRDELKKITTRFIELVSSMHESDVSQKEWTIWNNFEIQFLREKIDHQANLILELTEQIIDLKKMI